MTTLDGLRAELGERLAQMRETGVYKPERLMASRPATRACWQPSTTKSNAANCR